MDAVDVPNVCVPGRFVLERRTAAVMFLLDRSTSMNLGINGMTTRPTRWEAVRDGLAITLPRFDALIQTGAVFFPRVPRGNDIGALCEVLPNVDVVPATNRAADVLGILRSTGPMGGTPTFQALRVAQSYFSSDTSRGRARYIVLATDGGPNCNEALDPIGPPPCTCTSTNMAGMPTCSLSANGRYNCLDDRRTLMAIHEAAVQGVPTYVIGIDDPSRPELTDVLNRMAIEGGRPSVGTGVQRYYSARRAEDLLRAFDTITTAIARCAYVTASRPTTVDDIRLSANGSPLSRDTDHRDGWDWTDPNYGEITLFGATCDRVVAANARLEAQVGCHDGGD